MTEKTAQRLADAERLRVLIEKYRTGEDPDLSGLCRALWEILYSLVPSLTRTKSKSGQHRILERHLVAIGLPSSPDLQYIAGPVLWFARERHKWPPTALYTPSFAHRQEPALARHEEFKTEAGYKIEHRAIAIAPNLSRPSAKSAELNG